MQKRDNKTLFSQVAPARLFFIAAVPGALGMLASSLYQLLDGIMVGQFLGDTAFAAVNLAMPFVIINFSIADLIGVGSSVLISHSLGRKEDATANNIFTCACIAIVASGAALGVVLFAAAPGLLRLMGADGQLLEYGVQYMRVYALCSPVTTIIFAVDNYLRVCGMIKGSLVMNVAMSVLCVGLEFLFLFVCKWGIWAAALGTALGMMVCAVAAFVPFFARKLCLKFCRPKFNLSMIRRTISCGAPNFLNNVAARITSIFMNMLLLRFGGETAVSIYGVLMYAEGFVQPLMYGTCDSLQPAIGFNWGAGDVKRTFAISRYCLSACAIVSVAAAVLMLLIPEQLTSLFLENPDPSVLETARVAVRIFALTYFVRWVSFAAQSFFLAIGKSVQASILSVSVALVVPLLLIGAFYPLELTGLWLNTPVTAVIVGALAVVLFAAFMRNLRKKPPFGAAAASAATAAAPDTQSCSGGDTAPTRGAPAGDGQETAAATAPDGREI